MSDTRLAGDVDLEELCEEWCKEEDYLTGADIKSVACDALVKAFHRAHNELDDSLDQSEIRSSIEICRADLVSSLESVKKTISKKEREQLKLMSV